MYKIFSFKELISLLFQPKWSNKQPDSLSSLKQKTKFFKHTAFKGQRFFKRQKTNKVSKSFPDGSNGKESACNAETWVQSLGWEDTLEKGMATHHSSVLAWITRSQTRLSNFHFFTLLP